MRQELTVPLVLRAEDLLVVVDTREQRPWDLSPLRMERGTLGVGDYSLRGLKELAVIERKALGDFVTCCGRDRGRFVRELRRLRGIPHAAVVIEAGWEDLVDERWPGKVTAETVKSSIASWTARYVPFVLAGSRAGAEDFARRYLVSVARRRWFELRGLVEAVSTATSASNG